mgnify:CR=1 FL=1
MIDIRLSYIGRSILDLIERVTEEEFLVRELNEWSTYPCHIAMDYRDTELVLDITGNLDSEI